MRGTFVPVTVEDRARRFAALGDPVRLAMVEHLVATDCTPRDLGMHVGVASNLLNHHLQVLEDAGLIRRSRSTGDGRLRYVSLEERALDLVTPRRARRPRRPLFVCTHNSARSQLAAAVWTAVTGDDASSAGTHPADRVNPAAVSAARRAGLDISANVPRLVGPSDRSADLVITVCDRANEEITAGRPRVHWSIPDPSVSDTAKAFDRAISQIENRIRRLVDEPSTVGRGKP